MKRLTILIIVLLAECLVLNSLAFAGGAAARRRQGAARQKQMIQQRQRQQEMIRQRALQQQQAVPVQTEIDVFQEPVQRPVMDETEITEVTLADIWAAFDQSSHAWTQIVDDEAKQATIVHYIETLRQQGAIIRKPAGYYVQMIDSMSQNNPDMLNQPFLNILRIAAIIEYDFDNGQDKDALARQVLGEKGFISNKKRLSQPR